MSSKSHLFKNISSLFIVQVANVVLPIITVPIIVRIIGPYKFGLINYSAAIVSYFVLVISFAFNLTASRRMAHNKNDKHVSNNIFNEVLGAQLFLWLICSIIFVILLFTLPVFKTNQFLFFVTYCLTISTVLTPDWIYQGMGDLQRLAFFNLISKVFLSILVVIIIKKPEDFYLQPLSLSIVQIVVTFFSLVWAIKKYNFRIKLPTLKHIFSILNGDKLVFFSTIVISLYTTTNIVVLGAFTNESEVGYFTAAQKFILLAQSVLAMPLANALFPFISSEFGISQNKGIETVKKIAPFVFTFTFLLGLVMSTVGVWFIGIFYGNSFEKSKLLFLILSFVPFLISISNICGIQVMLNLNFKKQFFRITAVGAVCSMVINALLVVKIGSIGAAVAWLITELIVTLSMVYFLNSRGIYVFRMKDYAPKYLLNTIFNLLLKLKTK
jgi:PST family polysaccharide transporter